MISNNSFPIDKWDFKSDSILSNLSGHDLELLLVNRTQQMYAKGEIIFREGAVPSGVFLIVQGKVKKYKLDSEGRERIIYVANTGELIGFHAILSEDRYPDSAAPLEESKIAFIPREDFTSTLNQSSQLNRLLLKTLSHEFAVLVNSLSVFGHKTVRERLALQLIVLSEKYKVATESIGPSEINMSRTDLANLVGTARENVVRLLSEFKEEGIISTTGRKIKINHLERLIRIANCR